MSPKQERVLALLRVADVVSYYTLSQIVGSADEPASRARVKQFVSRLRLVSGLPILSQRDEGYWLGSPSRAPSGVRSRGRASARVPADVPSGRGEDYLVLRRKGGYDHDEAIEILRLEARRERP